jgi:voltage-gated potassium channel
MDLRKRTYEILDVARPHDRPSKAFDIFIITLIGLNVVALILQSVEHIRILCPTLFRYFEVASVVVFSIEYILRLWSCVENPSYTRPISGRVRFAMTPLAIIDLLAVLPFYLPFTGLDLRFLRVVRMMRIFRVAKLGRYSQSVQTLSRVIRARKEQLATSIFVLLLLLVIASSLMYFAENSVQPESFSSIPAAMWWAVATLTTVGYGDVYPVTELGKLVGSIIAILGIGMFALPTGILGAGFVEELQKTKGSPKRCPHCGKEIGPG